MLAPRRPVREAARRARPSTCQPMSGRVEGGRALRPGPARAEESFVLGAVLLSFGVIFVAELGDKSQLMALTFATRYRAVPILIGITIATALVHAVSVVVGAILGAALPTRTISIVAGLAFFGFAAWTLRGDTLDEEEASRAERTTHSAV